MAGDWIKMERATIDKPEVLEMADLLGMNADEVFGKLFRVWCWFDQQSRDGHAGSVTNVTLAKFIDRLVASQGFAACMQKVGWLNDSGMPNFERHNGESAKNRALAKDRKAKERSRECHGESVTREEKRREERKQGAPTDVGPVWGESLTILTEQGQSEKTARAFLGMLCRDYDESEITDAVKAAVGKANVTSYIRGVLKSRPRKGERELKRVAI